MSDVEHSPTPWRVIEMAENAIDIVDANGKYICQIVANDTTDILTEVDRENAAAIVRYVNSCSDD